MALAIDKDLVNHVIGKEEFINFITDCGVYKADEIDMIVGAVHYYLETLNDMDDYLGDTEIELARIIGGFVKEF